MEKVSKNERDNISKSLFTLMIGVDSESVVDVVLQHTGDDDHLSEHQRKRQTEVISCR